MISHLQPLRIGRGMPHELLIRLQRCSAPRSIISGSINYILLGYSLPPPQDCNAMGIHAYNDTVDSRSLYDLASPSFHLPL